MTALPPPTYYFDGITFNSAFYPSTSTVTSSSGNGITEAQANLLYLRKTTTDTATSLETFSAGIATSSIDTASSGGTLTIGGTNATGGLNIGKSTFLTSILGNASVAGTLGAGASTLSSVITGAITPTSNTGQLDIGATQTTGILNIGTGSRTGAGVINIGTNGNSTSGVNIGTWGSKDGHNINWNRCKCYWVRSSEHWFKFKSYDSKW